MQQKNPKYSKKGLDAFPEKTTKDSKISKYTMQDTARFWKILKALEDLERIDDQALNVGKIATQKHTDKYTFNSPNTKR